MRLLDFGSLVAALGVAEWVVLAALVLVFGRRTIVVVMRIMRWLAAFAAAVVAIALLYGFAAAAFVLAAR